MGLHLLQFTCKIIQNLKTLIELPRELRLLSDSCAMYTPLTSAIMLACAPETSWQLQDGSYLLYINFAEFIYNGKAK